MLASITPLGERSRHRRWGTTAAWYTAGAIFGGATIGGLSGGVGSVVPEAGRPTGALLAGLVIVAFGIAALIETGRISLRLPSLPRQVNENWLDTYRGWVIGLGFGYQLGLAVITIITSPAVHAMLLLSALSFSVPGGLLIGAAFGLARAVPLWATRSVTSPAQLRRLHTTMQAWAQPTHGIVAVALVAAGLLVGVGALG